MNKYKTKKNLYFIVISVLTLFIFISSFNFSIKAHAGYTREVFSDYNMLFNGDEINTSNFKFGKGISVEKEDDKNVVFFNSKAGNKDVLLSYLFPTVTPLEDGKETLNIETIINVKEIKGDKRFGMILGAQRLDVYPGALESSYLYFENTEDDKYKVTFNQYSNNGDITTFFSDVVIPKNLDLKINIKQYNDKKIYIKIDDYYEFNGENVELGHVGFGLMGNFTDKNNYIKALIKQFDVTNYYYSNPENCNLFTDFETDYINNEQWILKNQVSINNGQLEFNDASHTSFIATRHKFSNFQLNFDLTYIKNDPTIDDKGNILMNPTEYFWVIYGLNAEYADSLNGHTSSVEYPNSCGYRISCGVDTRGYSSNDAYIRSGKCYDITHKPNDCTTPIPIEYNIWNEHFKNRIANFRITMIDGISKLEMKWNDQDVYQLIVEQNLNYTPEGFIMISAAWSEPKYSTNCAIDNIQVTNLDKNPSLIETGFSKTGIQNNGDYVFKDTRNPTFMFDIQNNVDDEFPVIQVVLSCVFTIIFILGCTFIFVYLLGRKKNE